METTDFENSQMERLAVCARIILEDAERLASGKWVNITILCGVSEGGRTDMYPARVAAYVATLLGEAPLFSTEYAVTFSDGVATSSPLYTTPEGIIACYKALVAWQRADRRYLRRKLAQKKAIIKREEGGLAV